MFSHFLRIMQQDDKCHVNVQLLQTLNILFENIRNETSLCNFYALKLIVLFLFNFRFLAEQQPCECDHFSFC